MSSASHSSSLGSSSSSVPCSRCGVDVATAFQQIDTARRKLQLLQEKLQVDQELLKQDKRNFRRRVKAAKAAASNRQAEAEKIESQSRQAEEEARKQQREYEENIGKVKQSEKSLQVKHDKEVRALKDRIRILESLQQAKEKDSVDLQDDIQKKLDESEKEIARLKGALDDKCSSLESYEMQLLELERGHQDDHQSETCVNCRRLERQLQDSEARLSSFEENQLQAQRKLRREKDNLENSLRRLQERGQTSSDEVTSELERLKDDMEALRIKEEGYRTTAEAQTKEIEDLKKANASLQSQLKERATNKKSVPVLAPTTTVDKAEPTSATHEMVTEYEWHGSELSGIYTGWVDKDKNPDGNGTLRVDNGDVYDGEWSSGQRHGRGVLASVEGDVYRGGWHEDRFHGRAVYVWSDGRLYRGQYVNGDREGEGIMTFPYGATYRGEYRSDKRNGEGMYNYADGRCYTGSYKDDRPHGYGVLKAADGTVIYDGQWELGEFIGPS